MKIIADSNIPFVAECFSSIGEVEVVSGREITPDVVADADVLLVRSVTQVDSDLLAESGVRFVGSATIGFDHIDIDFLREHNIGFASAPGSNANSTAEYVIAALLSVAKERKIQLEGMSLGIVGVGNVGSRVEKKAKGLGMKVLLNDPPLQRSRTKRASANAVLVRDGDRKYQPIEELYECDFITLHTPLTFEGKDRTFHLADERFFKSLKKRCVFVNTSRGGVVDTVALKAAIKSGRLEAAVLDVWEDEPNIDTELLEMVDIGTPHIAGYSLDGKVAGMIVIYKTACKYFGLEAKFGMESFLSAPVVPELKINPRVAIEQDVLQEAVEKIYDIKKDDSDLRWILDKPAGKRGKFFDDLRKSYPVRREFQNTRIILATEDTESTEDKLKRNSSTKALSEKLKGIGFKVVKVKN
jgi:erythronate-4-phosphate dehydrogenase